ncbi:hypothetical protein HDU92_009068 [Lobulomyces angularis]|nr:hypothetical protein HDU92_009068 [Lobulomyces angularis]
MAIVNVITYYALMSEMLLFVLTLIPLSFISTSFRKRFMERTSTLFFNDYILWLGRILLFIVTTVLVDTLIRLRKMDQDIRTGKNIGKNGQIHDALTECQVKSKLFYSHRNMYMSLFALFMVLVLYVRMREIYSSLVKQEELDLLNSNFQKAKDELKLSKNLSLEKKEDVVEKSDNLDSKKKN